MVEENFNQEHNDSGGKKATMPTASVVKKKASKQPWIIILAVVAFVIVSSIFKQEVTIDWVRDYQEGIEKAKKENKPILLAFYKKQMRFCTLMDQNTYNNSEVKKYIEANFVPIFIDVDEQPELAREYNIGYYPTHYVKMPNSSDLIGPQMGYDTPSAFIKILEGYLERAKATGK